MPNLIPTNLFPKISKTEKQKMAEKSLQKVIDTTNAEREAQQKIESITKILSAENSKIKDYNDKLNSIRLIERIKTNVAKRKTADAEEDLAFVLYDLAQAKKALSSYREHAKAETEDTDKKIKKSKQDLVRDETKRKKAREDADKQLEDIKTSIKHYQDSLDTIKATHTKLKTDYEEDKETKDKEIRERTEALKELDKAVSTALENKKFLTK